MMQLRMIYSVKLGRFYYRHYITKNNLDLYRLEAQWEIEC